MNESVKAVILRPQTAVKNISLQVAWRARTIGWRLQVLARIAWFYICHAARMLHLRMQPLLNGVLRRDQPLPPESREVLDSIRQPVRFGVRIGLASGLFFIVWGGLAPLDSASIAPGSVVMDSSRKTIQHLEGGVITDILVKDGDRVKAGQELLKLNPTTAKARQDTVAGKLLSDQLAQARLLAEKEGAEHFDPAPALKANNITLDEEDEDLKKLIETQTNVFETRRKDYLGQREILDQRIAQSNERIEGLTAQKDAAERQLALLGEELHTLTELVDKGLAVRSKLLDSQREKAMLEGNIGNYISEIANTREKIGETETQKLTLEAQYQKEVASDLKDVQQQIAELSEQLTASSDIYRRTVITAPLSGEVTGLRYHTIGGVIAPGAPILDIVPDQDTMVIEARIPPQDIDMVHTGSPAKVRLTAYRNRFMPRLQGTLIHVSADKFTDEKTMMSYYLGRVRINEEDMTKYRDEFKLYPGMPAEVFIVTGSHTLLTYLLYPLLGSFQRGLSED